MRRIGRRGPDPRWRRGAARTSGASRRCRTLPSSPRRTRPCRPTSRSWRTGGTRSPSHSTTGGQASSFAARARTGPRSASWAGAGGEPPEFVPLLRGDFDRADAAGDAIVFADPAGRVAQVGFDGTRDWPPPPRSGVAWRRPSQGRRMRGDSSSIVPAARSSAARPIDGRDGMLDAAWSVAGSLPALDVDVEAARSRLVVADGSDPGPPVHGDPRRPGRPRCRPVGSACGRRSTSASSRSAPAVDTSSISGPASTPCRSNAAIGAAGSAGVTRSRAPTCGHPAVDVVDGVPVVIADDHGELRRYDGAGSVAWVSDWTAAYTMPIPGPWGPERRRGRSCGRAASTGSSCSTREARRSGARTRRSGSTRRARRPSAGSAIRARRPWGR